MTFSPFSLCILFATALLAAVLVASVAVLLVVLADFAEENAYLFRNALKVLLVVNVVVHISILCVDGISVVASVLSILLNVLYAVYLKDFPYVPFKKNSLPLLAATATGAVAESLLWFWKLSSDATYYYNMTSWSLISFLLFLWLVPLLLVVSVSVEDDRLPGFATRSGRKL
ncbi:hypothetical protein AGDE_15542 [Angomonas deanei]|uniref:Transmembrane adaptor Erv26, putative n=1 Tax=Angomonas deanei TaxID=59799 RepID=A0A7G2CTF0_9TRYP|nr:hypothetical protein AGDE_15542 [Angomonas deanei]CAD2221502.1 Transmembrane adaptor Erv26, putative [Angomonas deanei]|eukprot:EPY18920.1 hypothetical protein AGDE_15542 [Angomonas deanei]